MSRPEIPPPAKLIASIIGCDATWIDRAIEALEREFGPCDFRSELMKFDQTDYYNREMGEGLVRRFVSFEEPAPRGDLARIKLTTNEIEKSMAREDGARRVNIDPGMVTLENLVLATGKNRAHRIYLADGIYADLTLIYKKGSYHPLPWTYPDYSKDDMIRIMNKIRAVYKEQLRNFLAGTKNGEAS